MDTHLDLAVADLAQCAGVLPGHSGRRHTVFEEAGVVHYPDLRSHHCHRPAGQPCPDRFHRPGRRRHELLQLLVIHPEATSHRLHRLPPPVQEQATQIQAVLHPLIRPRQRLEHLPGELLQPVTKRSEFIRPHTRREAPDCRPNKTPNKALLVPYVTFPLDARFAAHVELGFGSRRSCGAGRRLR